MADKTRSSYDLQSFDYVSAYFDYEMGCVTEGIAQLIDLVKLAPETDLERWTMRMLHSGEEFAAWVHPRYVIKLPHPCTLNTPNQGGPLAN